MSNMAVLLGLTHSDCKIEDEDQITWHTNKIGGFPVYIKFYAFPFFVYSVELLRLLMLIIK